MWTYAVMPRRSMQLAILLVLTDLGLAIGSSTEEKAFVRKHRSSDAWQMATLDADGHVAVSKSIHSGLAPLALGSVTPDGYYKLKKGQESCGADNITSEVECKKAAIAIGIDMKQGLWTGHSPSIPNGCSAQNSRAYWNGNNFTGVLNQDLFPICQRSSEHSEPATPVSSLAASHADAAVQPKYYLMDANTCCCPEPNQIKTEADCKEAVAAVGVRTDIGLWSGENQYIPSACSAQYGSRGYFNKGKEFDSRVDMLPVCQHAFGPEATKGAQFYRMPYGSQSCSAAHKVSSEEECQGAAIALGLKIAETKGEIPWVGQTDTIPSGCSHQYGGRVHWNKGTSGKLRTDMSPMCSRPPKEDLKYFRMPPGHTDCGVYEPVTTEEECKAAAAAVGFDRHIAQFLWKGNDTSIPANCAGQLSGRPHFNQLASAGGSRADIFPICKQKAEKSALTAAPAKPTVHTLLEINDEIQQETASFYPLNGGAVGCSENEKVRSLDECKKASHNIGFKLQFGIWAGNTSDIPGGCSAQRWGKIHWNIHQTGGSRSDMIPICKGAALPPIPGL